MAFAAGLVAAVALPAGNAGVALASGHVREGLPQVKKFYVYLMLFLVTSAVRTVKEIRWVALGWALAATLSSAWALRQFFEKYRAAERAHQNFYPLTWTPASPDSWAIG